MTGLGGTSAIMSLAAIAIDRYRVISHPLDRKPTRSRSLIISCFIWLYSALFAGLPFVGVGRYVPEGYLTSCSFDYLASDWTNRVFIFSFLIAAWVFPLTLIIFCYSTIVRTVIHVRKSIMAVNGITMITKKPIKKALESLDEIQSSRESNEINEPAQRGI